MCAQIIPFKAVRPVRDKVHLVASRPYYSYTKQILRAKLIENPYTFIHIINPEFRKSDKTDPNTIERFEKVRDRYLDFKEDGVFTQDAQPTFYLYRQTSDGHAFVGLIAGASIDEYWKKQIKIHEQTLTQREQTFQLYLDVCGFNAEPVLLTHPERPSLSMLYEQLMEQRPEYEFTTTDKIKHELWLIQDKGIQSRLQEEFAAISSVYIADGHHRCASSALLGKNRNNNPIYQKRTGHHHFLAYFIPEGSLKIYDFNRLLLHTNNLSEEEILERLAKDYQVSQISKKAARPEQKHHFSMYLSGRWYHLELKQPPLSDDPTAHLDAQILSETILHPIFGIEDLKTDPNIAFLSGKLGMKGLQKQVDKGKAKIAFALYPVSVSELMHIADTNNIMPPKSTYIEPKLRSGLTIYEI